MAISMCTQCDLCKVTTQHDRGWVNLVVKTRGQEMDMYKTIDVCSICWPRVTTRELRDLIDGTH